MKKALLSILTIIYLFSVTGAVLHTHYCMGRISSINFSNSDKCDKCGMMDMTGCCDEHVKVYKVNDSHTLTEANNTIATFFVIIDHNIDPFSIDNLVSYHEILIKNTSPPGKSGKDMCIDHQLFLI